MFRQILLSVSGVFTLAFVPVSSFAREWTDASGQYNVEAKFVTADESHVVLERDDEDELLLLRRDQLSESDQEFVTAMMEKEKPVSVSATDDGDLDDAVDSVWHLDDGQVIRGQLEGFGRQKLMVARQLGQIVVNGKKITELPPAYLRIVPDVVSHVDNVDIDTLEDLEDHLTKAGGKPVPYLVEGIQVDLKSFGRIVIPIGLLANDEAEAVEAGFARWKASQAEEIADEERYEAESRERLMLNSYQKFRRKQRVMNRRMKLMELQLLAAQATNLDLWEVTLRPPNAYAYPVTIVVPADTSLIAQQIAARNYPQWIVGATVAISE